MAERSFALLLIDTTSTVDLVTGILLGSPGLRSAYLKSFDPDGRDGFGDISFTHDIKEAKHFATMSDALAEYRRQGTRRPLRPDGKPNRPMTSYSVEIKEVPET